MPKILCGSAAFLILGHASGAEFYVDVDARGGPPDDSGPGTLQRPWRTLGRMAAAQEPRPQPGDTVLVREGVYREQAGKVIMPGDEITVVNSRTRINALDRRAKTLTLDRPLRWQQGDFVSYAYAGKAPAVGAFESGLAGAAH